MKILFILENTIKSLEGGTEVSSFHLARLLRRKGIEVEEWAPYSRRMSIYLYTGLFFQTVIFFCLLWKCVKNRPHILHIQGKYLLPPAILVGKALNIPTVVTIRDYIVVCPIGLCLFDSFYKGLTLNTQGEALSDYLKNEIPLFLSKYHSSGNSLIKMLKYIFLVRGWIVSRWLKLWLKQADTVISVSEAVKKILSQNGISSQVIHNSFDMSFSLALNKAWPWVSKARPFNTILFVGKSSYGKGYDLFKELGERKEFSKYKFKTIGDNAKLGYEATLREIKMALAVIVPSRWPEPFGRVALEALMLGTPVVASARGGLIEIISNGKTGILAEPAVGDMAGALRLIIKQNKRLRVEIKTQKMKLKDKFESAPLKSHINLYANLLAKIDS